MRFFEQSFVFVCVIIPMFFRFDITKNKSKSDLDFAAKSSWLNTSSTFSLIILVSNFDLWKLNTLGLPFCISVSTRKCWQALKSFLSFSPSSPYCSTILFKSVTVSLGFRCLAPCFFPDVVGESSKLGTLVHKKDKPSTALNLVEHASWQYDNLFLF